MGDDGDPERVAAHRCDANCAAPVRCIVCNRLKAPSGAVVPVELVGMRCDPLCAGYLLDPRPGHRWPVFERIDERTPSLRLDDPVALLAWALHQAHPLGGRVSAAVAPSADDLRTPRPVR